MASWDVFGGWVDGVAAGVSRESWVIRRALLHFDASTTRVGNRLASGVKRLRNHGLGIWMLESTRRRSLATETGRRHARSGRGATRSHRRNRHGWPRLR